MTIAKRLKEFRAAMHLTALETADKLGIPARTIGSYERGEVLPGSKFYDLMIKKYNINLNWLVTGRGSMFISQNLPKDSLAEFQEEIKLSNKDMETLAGMLKSEASRDMILKFIEVKRGNKEALSSLITSLEGIKSVF